MGSLLGLAAFYLLQVNDSVPAPVVAAAPQAPAVKLAFAGVPSSERDYFLSRVQIVPLGLDTLSLPILMYHYIRTPPSIATDWLGYKLSVAPADFQVQMDWLSRHGYHAVDFNDIRAYFAGVQPLPNKPVVITFDDGYADVFTSAYPILVAHKFKAVAYIVSSFVGWPGYVTVSQIRQMDGDGIEIASHTVHHPNLARSSAGSVFRELTESKQFLEQVLGHPVVDFAYPSGQFTPAVVTAVRSAGYSTAVTTFSSTNHSLADRYTWTRVRVGAGESMEDFVHALGPVMPSISIRVVDVEPVAAPRPVKPRLAAREA